MTSKKVKKKNVSVATQIATIWLNSFSLIPSNLQNDSNYDKINIKKTSSNIII